MKETRHINTRQARRHHTGDVCVPSIYMPSPALLRASVGFCGDVMACPGDGAMVCGVTQRGAGIDHPNKVQQKNAQTHTSPVHSHPLSYCDRVLYSANSLFRSILFSRSESVSLGSLGWFAFKGIFSDPRGISYPVSYIRVSY